MPHRASWGRERAAVGVNVSLREGRVRVTLTARLRRALELVSLAGLTAKGELQLGAEV